MNLCNHFRKDIETCKLDGNTCTYDDDWKECPKLNRKKSNMRIKGISDAGLARVSRRVAQEEPDEQGSYDNKSDEIYSIFMNYEKELDASIEDVAYSMVGPTENVVSGWDEEVNSEMEKAFSDKFNPAWENIVQELSEAGYEVTPEMDQRVAEVREKFFSDLISQLDDFKRKFLNLSREGFASELSSEITKLLIGRGF